MEANIDSFTIGIFEDNPIVVQGLKSYFDQNSNYPLSVVFSASKPSEFFSNQQKLNADFLIVDIISDQVTGLEIFEQIFREDPEAIVFAYSNIKSLRIIQSLVTMGIAGFVPKTDPLETFNTAFESLLKLKQTYLPEKFKTISPKKEFPVVLTKTEKKIIPYLIEGRSSKEIAETFFITPSAVDYHKKNLFQKFKVNNIASFVKEVIHQGYAGGINF